MSQSNQGNITEKKKCRTVTLSDHPADEDAFGSHKRVAEAIAELIKEEDGGKAISLTGCWGSGKSTVVKFIKQILADNKSDDSCSSSVFVFDAWAHEKDPLRRSFLEKIIDHFIEVKWIKPEDEKEWQKEKEELARRIKTSETTQTTQLTKEGIIFALSIFATPIGYALISNIKELTLESFLWKLLIALAPIIVALCILIRTKNKDIIGLLVSKSPSKITSETIETPDPTSIEFQEIFVKLLKEAIEENQNRKVLVVIDNIDRMEPEDALSIWSTMRTFFEHDGQTEHSWMTRFWLLVPYDAIALNRLWKEEQHDSQKEDANGADGRSYDLVDAFREKTFQLNFNVSPPVLSDWKDFFKKQLAVAFPDHKGQEELDLIYHLFRIKGTPDNRPLTPRDIKLFVNRVGSLHRQWQDDIPLLNQALYVLYHEEITKKGIKFFVFEKEPLDSRIRNIIIGDDWKKNLAALHLNIEPEKALQVLLGPEVEKMLSTGDAEAFLKYQSTPGIIEVCENVLEENYADWGKEQASSLALAGLVLSKIEDGVLRDSLGQCWRSLYLGIKGVKKWPELNEKVGKGVAMILKNSSNYELQHTAGLVLKSISKEAEATGEVESEEKQPIKPDVIRQWVNGCLPVLRALVELGQQEVITGNFRVPGTAESYLEVLAAQDKYDDNMNIVGYFVPQVDSGVIINGSVP